MESSKDEDQASSALAAENTPQTAKDDQGIASAGSPVEKEESKTEVSGA